MVPFRGSLFIGGLKIFPDWHAYKEERCKDFLLDEAPCKKQRLDCAENEADCQIKHKDQGDLEDDQSGEEWESDGDNSSLDEEANHRAIAKNVVNYMISYIQVNENIDCKRRVLNVIDDEEDSGIIILSD